MERITTLQIFDFDETLVRAPSYTSKKQVESDQLKFGSPYEFYDHPKSLCENTHNIQLISPVYDAWRRGSDDSATFSALITHRVKSLSAEVGEILKNRAISFGSMFFLGREKNKTEIAEELLNTFPNLEKIEIYEDSIQQIFLYQTFFSRENNKRIWRDGLSKLEVAVYIVDKSRVFKIEDLKLTDEKKIKLI